MRIEVVDGREHRVSHELGYAAAGGGDPHRRWWVAETVCGISLSSGKAIGYRESTAPLCAKCERIVKGGGS